MDWKQPKEFSPCTAMALALDEINRPQPIIIGLTADGSSETRDQCLACGMNHFLSQPVKLETWQQVLL